MELRLQNAPDSIESMDFRDKFMTLGAEEVLTYHGSNTYHGTWGCLLGLSFLISEKTI